MHLEVTDCQPKAWCRVWNTSPKWLIRVVQNTTPDQYRVLSLFLVSCENMMVNSCCWGHMHSCHRTNTRVINLTLTWKLPIWWLANLMASLHRVGRCREGWSWRKVITVLSSDKLYKLLEEINAYYCKPMAGAVIGPRGEPLLNQYSIQLTSKCLSLYT